MNETVALMNETPISSNPSNEITAFCLTCLMVRLKQYGD